MFAILKGDDGGIGEKGNKGLRADKGSKGLVGNDGEIGDNGIKGKILIFLINLNVIKFKSSNIKGRNGLNGMIGDQGNQGMRLKTFYSAFILIKNLIWFKRTRQ